MFSKILEKNIDEVLKFCLELKNQNARMSFVSLDTIEKLEKSINDPLNYYFISRTDDGIITSMFKATRGVANKSHSVYISCAVKKEYRKHNIATSMVDYALGELKKHGVKIARTKIYSWNKPSIATIKKCGFLESGRIVMHEYDEELGTYIDDLIFHKLL